MSINIILTEHVNKLGEAGEIVSVKDGYARNYLLPGGQAILATAKNLLMLKEQKAEIQAIADQKREEAKQLKDKIEKLGDITIEAAVGPTGKLFGRITVQDITEQVNQKLSLSLKRTQISISDYNKGIDELGKYEIIIDLSAGVYAKLSLNVIELS